MGNQLVNKLGYIIDLERVTFGKEKIVINIKYRIFELDVFNQNIYIYFL